MNYELAKQLKDAGFPQKRRQYCEDAYAEGGASLHMWQHYNLSPEEEFKEPTVYIPTLSELIEACGKLTMYFGLEKHSNDWRAGTLKEGGMNQQVSGKTLEEAVARLYLALNKN